KLDYIKHNVGSDPARLPHHFAEFLGYATLLYDHYAEYIKAYEEKEAKIVKDENEQRLKINADAETREDRVTVTEVEQRIAVRLGTMKAEKKRLDIAV